MVDKIRKTSYNDLDMWRGDAQMPSEEVQEDFVRIDINVG